MWVHPNEKQHLARYVHALMLGECIAARCASAQAQMATASPIRRFFSAQARQEKVHAAIFQHVARWLAPKGAAYPQAVSLMHQYDALIEDAIQRQDLAETVLGAQVMLESLGEICLDRLDAGISNRGLGFRRLRRIVLNQERAHHDFGRRQLDAYVAADDGVRTRLQERAPDYGALIDQMIVAFQSAFECFDEDMTAFQHDVQQGFPSWIVNAR